MGAMEGSVSCERENFYVFNKKIDEKLTRKERFGLLYIIISMFICGVLIGYALKTILSMRI